MAHGYPDYEGDKQRVYLVPEWAALGAVDKTFVSGDTGKARNDSVVVNYIVPAGKTLYITTLSCYSGASGAADSDLNQMCKIVCGDATTGTNFWTQAGNGGVGAVLSKPGVIPAGHQAQFSVVNLANHNCDIGLSVLGYEV